MVGLPFFLNVPVYKFFICFQFGRVRVSIQGECFWGCNHPVYSVSVTPSKARLIGFCYKWKFQSIVTERNSRVSLRSTQLFLTMSMRLGCCSSNDDLLDGSTKRRLMLAEVEPSNGFGGWLTDVGHHFRLIVFYAMPEVTTFWEKCVIRFAPCR